MIELFVFSSRYRQFSIWFMKRLHGSIHNSRIYSFQYIAQKYVKATVYFKCILTFYGLLQLKIFRQIILRPPPWRELCANFSNCSTFFCVLANLLIAISKLAILTNSFELIPNWHVFIFVQRFKT